MSDSAQALAEPIPAGEAGGDLLVMKNVSKAYRGAVAVQNVDFALREGEIHALLGENGAGKSTLTKMMCGVTEPTSGEVFYRGKPYAAATPADAREHGIVMVFQETSLVNSMTVAQNLYLGDETAFNRLRPLDISAQVFLSSLNFEVDPLAQAGTLGAAKKQMVEIARAVHHDAKVIIFDEPTRDVDVGAIAEIHAMINGLADAGLAATVTSSYLPEIQKLSDRILVMRSGRVVAEFDPTAVEDEIMFASVHWRRAAAPQAPTVSRFGRSRFAAEAPPVRRTTGYGPKALRRCRCLGLPWFGERTREGGRAST